MSTFLAAALKPFVVAVLFGLAWLIGWPIRRYLRTLPANSRWRILLKRLTWYG